MLEEHERAILELEQELVRVSQKLELFCKDEIKQVFDNLVGHCDLRHAQTALTGVPCASSTS